jgi:SAM-dependent methyltransferase
MSSDQSLVRAQYESLPYPARDPREEKRRLITGSPSHLAELEHFLFAGRIARDRPFRALVAGGGTGDAAIMLGQQLKDAGIPAEITYLDLSEASRRIAEARAKTRGLEIRFVTGSLLGPELAALGRFDYIDCCGVLHHLPDPPAGFRALAERLAPQGGMGVMVYAGFGRNGVYDLQAILARLAPADLDLRERLALAKRLLRQLPATNRYRRGPMPAKTDLGEDEIFDRFLHAQDRAYRIGALLDSAAAAGLRLAGLLEQARYEPATYLSDPIVRARFASLPDARRWIAGEAIAGCLWRHVVYLTRADHTAAALSPSDLDLVPLCRCEDGPTLAQAVGAQQQLRLTLDGLVYSLPLPRLAAAILARIDGQRPARAIHADLRAGPLPDLAEEEFRADYAALVERLAGFNRVLLRRA